MLTIALYEPEIPPNTGNIIRLAANTGADLALIEPLGFELTDVRLRRAGLDYRALATTTVYPDLDSFLAVVGQRRVLAFSTRGTRRYDTVSYRDDDVLLFGPETRGLPDEILGALPGDRRLRIPMHRHPDAKRAPSLNLGNAVSIALYEAWRQLGFS